MAMQANTPLDCVSFVPPARLCFFYRSRSKLDTVTANVIYRSPQRENEVQPETLRIPSVSMAGLRSIIEFRAETTAEVKKLALEIRRETTR